MKKTILFIVLITPLFVKSQANKPLSPGDSISYYQKELSKFMRAGIDSLRMSAEYRELTEKIKTHRGKSDHYSGVVVFGDLLHSDYTQFNKSIVANGFSPLNEMSFRLGIGASNKWNRTMLDFYLVTGGFNNRSKKGEEKISTSLSNLFQFDFGYDVLNGGKVALYPFAGLSVRMSNLKFAKPVDINSSYTDITNIITNNQSAEGESIRIGYQAGLGADFALTNGGIEKPSFLLFMKLGVNNSIGAEKYKINGVAYKPEIKQGDWLVSIGIKLVNWK